MESQPSNSQSDTEVEFLDLQDIKDYYDSQNTMKDNINGETTEECSSSNESSNESSDESSDESSEDDDLTPEYISRNKQYEFPETFKVSLLTVFFVLVSILLKYYFIY